MDINQNFNSIVGWIKEIWNKINIKQWAESIGGSSAQAVEAVIYFGIGFAFGFLFKKHIKTIIFSVLLSVFWIWFLQYNKILLIDRQALNVFLGFQPSADINIIFNSIFEWVKINIISVISGLVGFLVGCKLG